MQDPLHNTDEPLVDRIISISVLRAEYEGNPGAFVQQIDYLTSQGYDKIRRTKRV